MAADPGCDDLRGRDGLEGLGRFGALQIPRYRACDLLEPHGEFVYL